MTSVSDSMNLLIELLFVFVYSSFPSVVSEVVKKKRGSCGELNHRRHNLNINIEVQMAEELRNAPGLLLLFVFTCFTFCSD